MQKHHYPYPTKWKEIYKDSTQIFKDLSMKEDNHKNQNARLNELCSY